MATIIKRIRPGGSGDFTDLAGFKTWMESTYGGGLLEDVVKCRLQAGQTFGSGTDFTLFNNASNYTVMWDSGIQIETDPTDDILELGPAYLSDRIVIDFNNKVAPSGFFKFNGLIMRLRGSSGIISYDANGGEAGRLFVNNNWIIGAESDVANAVNTIISSTTDGMRVFRNNHIICAASFNGAAWRLNVFDFHQTLVSDEAAGCIFQTAIAHSLGGAMTRNVALFVGTYNNYGSGYKSILHDVLGNGTTWLAGDVYAQYQTYGDAYTEDPILQANPVASATDTFNTIKSAITGALISSASTRAYNGMTPGDFSNTTCPEDAFGTTRPQSTYSDIGPYEIPLLIKQATGSLINAKPAVSGYGIVTTIKGASIGTRATYSTGTIQTSGEGNRIVTLTGGTFDAQWGHGDTITINAIAYYIQSRDSDTQLTLQGWQTGPAMRLDSIATGATIGYDADIVSPADGEYGTIEFLSPDSIYFYPSRGFRITGPTTLAWLPPAQDLSGTGISPFFSTVTRTYSRVGNTITILPSTSVVAGVILAVEGTTIKLRMVDTYPPGTDTPPPSPYDPPFPRDVETCHIITQANVIGSVYTTLAPNQTYSLSRAYGSIAAWESDTDNDLVSSHEIRKGVCYNDSQLTGNTTVTSTAGYTNSNFYRILTVAEGSKHLGSKTGFSVDGTFTITEPYFRMEWIRITHPVATAAGAYVIDCPGSNTAKYITLNKIFIHDYNCTGNYSYLFGIRISGNGGCRILDCVITDLYKNNTEADEGGQAGIYIGSSSNLIPNYIYNCTVTNIWCKANFMFADGGIGVWDNKTIVKNCIALVRQYTYDQSSIPNYSEPNYADIYKYDFTPNVGSADRCVQENGGYYQANYLPHTWSNRSSSSLWTKIRCSATGQYVIAMLNGDLGDPLYYSDDYGENWSVIAAFSNLYQSDICISGDGQTILVVGSPSSGNPIFVSRNSGDTWSSYSGSASFYDFCGMSKDGLKIICSASNTSVAFSSDNGNNWSSPSTWTWNGTPETPLKKFRNIKLSEDGSYALMTVGGTPGGNPWVGVWSGSIYNFTEITTSTTEAISLGDFQGADISDSGQYMVTNCCANRGYSTPPLGRIYRSSNYGVTWEECFGDILPTAPLEISSSTNTSPVRIRSAYTKTWTRSGTTATVVHTNHPYGSIYGNRVYVVETSDVAAITVGLKATPIVIIDQNTYRLTCLNAGATSGTVVIRSENESMHLLRDGARVRIKNHTTNTNANGIFYAKYIDELHFDLYFNQALTVPVAGNGVGAYTGTFESLEIPWYPIAMSGDGKTIVSSSSTVIKTYGNGYGKPFQSGFVWMSNDYGKTFFSDSDYSQIKEWQSFAMSSDGLRMYGAIFNDYLKKKNVLIQSTAEQTFNRPGPGPDTGNGFYGWAFGIKSILQHKKHVDNFIYKCRQNETGTITFSDMQVFYAIGGYRYIDASNVGPLALLKPDGTAFDDGTPTYTYNGVYSYNAGSNSFTYVSGDTELGDMIELVGNTIRFKESYFSTNWNVLPTPPSGGGFTSDANGLIATSVTGPAILSAGAEHNNGFTFVITDRVYAGAQNLRLHETSLAVGNAETLSDMELAQDITGEARIEPWNIGAYPVGADEEVFGSGGLVNELPELEGSGLLLMIGSGELVDDLPETYGSGYACHIGSGELLNELPVVRGSTTDNRTISYSVGNSFGTDLKVGSGVIINIVNGIATFNIPQTGNIGKGDKVITSGNGTLYLDVRYSYSTWGMLDTAGLPPTDLFDTVVSIGRCFPTINAAVGSTGGVPHATGIANASFIGTSNLVAAGVIVNIVCYNDDNTSDTEPVIVKGYITGTRNYIYITAAGTNIGMFSGEGRIADADSDNYYSNYPQHSTNGTAGEGYVLDVQYAEADAAIDIYDCMVSVNNLDISGTVDIGIKIYGVSNFYNLGRGANNCRAKNCIVRNSGSYGIHVSGVSKNLSNVSVWGCLLYNQTSSNIRMINGITRAFVYNSIMDKGSSICSALSLGDGGNNFTRIDIAYNLFVGGNSNNDIVKTGPVVINTLVDNRGQDHNYFSTARTYSWFGNDRIANYDDMFMDRAGRNYNIKNTASQQYLAGYCSATYSLTASYEVWPYDLKASLRAAKPRISLGCLESDFSFEFNGSDVLFIDQQKLVYYANSDSGYFKSESDASTYAGTTFILSMDLESSEEYQKEAKMMIGVKRTRVYDKKYRILKEYRAIADIYRNTIFIDKDQSFNAAFFSRAIGSRNYIFKYDMGQRKLSIGIFDELEKGMSGKNNVLNQVRLGR